MNDAGTVKAAKNNGLNLRATR